MEPIVVVNGFVFCKKHGSEYCHRCTYDHRYTNDFQIQDDPVIAEIRENGVYDFENRESINVYSCGAIPVGGTDSEDCKCTIHHQVNCNTCFDWVGFFKDETKKAEDQEKWLKKREKYYRNRDD